MDHSAAAVAASPPPDGTPVTVGLFGTFRLVHAGRELRLRNRKARAVLALLAMAEGGEMTRERLSGLLWSESGEEKARASLRQVIHELRDVLPAGTLRADRLCVAIPPRVLHLDLDAVVAALAAGRLHPRLLDTPALPERLLDGLDDLDPAFTAWLQARRHALQEHLVAGLEAMLDGGRAPREVARALLHLDPTHEAACRAVMLDAAREGDVAGALRAYEALWNLLGEDFDMEPSAATQALVAEIKSGRIAPSRPASRAAAAPGSAGRRMALVVERFGEHGVPEERAHLVRGFRHDLIACLVRFREWFVLDGGEIPEGALGRVSSCYAVGAVAYQAGDAISLVLTIREIGTGLVIWSERSDLALATWFETQREWVRRIATSLKGQVSTARLAALPLQGGTTLAAHDRWLLGRSVMRGFRGDRYDRARALFEEVIAEDPAFSPAYSSLAQTLNGGHIASPGSWRCRAAEARALALAQRAVELDPMDSRAHLVMGWSLAMAAQAGAAVAHMRRAIKLNPHDSWTFISAALFHAFCDRHAEARDLAEAALDMALVPSPTLWGYQVVIAFLRGDDARTLEACDRAQDVIRTLPAWRAAALWNLGQLAAAREAARSFFGLARSAWVGPDAATEALMGRWLLHQYPFTEGAAWERLRSAAGGAGIPDGGIAFGQWYPA